MNIEWQGYDDTQHAIVDNIYVEALKFTPELVIVLARHDFYGNDGAFRAHFVIQQRTDEKNIDLAAISVVNQVKQSWQCLINSGLVEAH